nr:MAG TPA: hypothetical protein [Caudoviricetes sp.]
MKPQYFFRNMVVILLHQEVLLTIIHIGTERLTDV